MDTQFVDRILTCSDCHGEFIFTAGEQLFFYDKQFTNDPKRCKPCKSRRSGLSAAANGTGPAAAGISRTETRTECSECGVQTTVPFKPTQGRPVLCRQCFQAKARAAAPVGSPLTGPRVGVPVGSAVPLASESLTLSALTLASEDSEGATLSRGGALRAATSMAGASAASSVASAADLASIALAQPFTSAVPLRAPGELTASEVEPSSRVSAEFVLAELAGESA